MKVRYADNYISATIAAISSPYTTVSLGTGEVQRLLDALTISDWASVNTSGPWAVPISLLNAAGEPITAYSKPVVGHITAWDVTHGTTPDNVTVTWDNAPTSTVSSGAKLAVRLTARHMDALPQLRQHNEGDAVESTSYSIRPGSNTYILVASNSISISLDGDGSFEPTTGTPAVVLIDNSGEHTGVTVSANVHSWGTLRWRDGSTPAFTSGNKLMLVRIRWIDNTSAIGEWELYS